MVCSLEDEEDDEADVHDCELHKKAQHCYPVEGWKSHNCSLWVLTFLWQEQGAGTSHSCIREWEHAKHSTGFLSPRLLLPHQEAFVSNQPMWILVPGSSAETALPEKTQKVLVPISAGRVVGLKEARRHGRVAPLPLPAAAARKAMDSEWVLLPDHPQQQRKMEVTSNSSLWFSHSSVMETRNRKKPCFLELLHFAALHMGVSIASPFALGTLMMRVQPPSRLSLIQRNIQTFEDIGKDLTGGAIRTKE